MRQTLAALLLSTLLVPTMGCYTTGICDCDFQHPVCYVPAPAYAPAPVVTPQAEPLKQMPKAEAKVEAKDL